MQNRSHAKVSAEKFKVVMVDYITKEASTTGEQRRVRPGKRKELEHETSAVMVFV